MDVILFLHRGDGHVATVGGSVVGRWLEITDKSDNDVTIHIPQELVADAQSFAESINTYCQPRFKERGA